MQYVPSLSHREPVYDPTGRWVSGVEVLEILPDGRLGEVSVGDTICRGGLTTEDAPPTHRGSWRKSSEEHAGIGGRSRSSGSTPMGTPASRTWIAATTANPTATRPTHPSFRRAPAG
ncbi:hypothetical protein AB0D08_29285 [Kitasatospora sp. NPDC048540]|uniref:hypothetical protein n=1 Tax=Kitasatospora sp. NPDC048540 TaxID=3155634 RepID=UPI0033CDCF36